MQYEKSRRNQSTKIMACCATTRTVRLEVVGKQRTTDGDRVSGFKRANWLRRQDTKVQRVLNTRAPMAETTRHRQSKINTQAIANTFQESEPAELVLRPGQQELFFKLAHVNSPEWVLTIEGWVESYSGWMDATVYIAGKEGSDERQCIGSVTGNEGKLSFSKVPQFTHLGVTTGIIELAAANPGVVLTINAPGVAYCGHIAKWPAQPNEQPKVSGKVASITNRLAGEITISGARGITLERLDFMLWDPTKDGVLPIEMYEITLQPGGRRAEHRHSHAGFYQFFDDGIRFEVPHGLLIPSVGGKYSLETEITLKKGQLLHLPQSTAYTISNPTSSTVRGNYAHSFV